MYRYLVDNDGKKNSPPPVSAWNLCKAIIDGHPGNPDGNAQFLGSHLKRKFLFRKLTQAEGGAISRTAKTTGDRLR